jgi:uncharacterized protein
VLLYRIKWQVAVAVAAVFAGALYGGAQAAAAVALLAVFETSLSFDNAVVNAQVMRGMDPFWKRMFLVVGVPVAAFGMRFFFPIAIVALTSGLSLGSVLGMAFNAPGEYQRHLEDASIAINTLGGTFLALVFLEYFFQPGDGQLPWLAPVERALGKVTRAEATAIAIVLVVVLLDSLLVPASQRAEMFACAAIAIVVHFLASGTETLLAGFSRTAKHAGLAAFVYLEILDASFSLDGVIGAFAISNAVVVICLGLTVGALFVRTLTLYFDRAGTLITYAYLGNGAHWAVGTLAAILFARNTLDVPEPFTAIVGVVIIAAALASSLRHQRENGSAVSLLDAP